MAGPHTRSTHMNDLLHYSMSMNMSMNSYDQR